MLMLKNRINEAMMGAELTPADLARATKSTPAAVTFWLNGATKSLRAEKAELLEAATGYRAQWIVTGNGEKKVSPTAARPNVVTIERRQCTPTEVFDNLEAMLMQLDDSLRDGVAGALHGMAKDPSKPGNRAMLEAAFAPQTFAGENRRRK